MKPVKNSKQIVEIGQVWETLPRNGKLVPNSDVLITGMEGKEGVIYINYQYLRGYISPSAHRRRQDEFIRCAKLTNKRE